MECPPISVSIIQPPAESGLALFPTDAYCPFGPEGCKMKWQNPQPIARGSHHDRSPSLCINLIRRRVHKHLQRSHAHETFQANLLISPSGYHLTLRLSEIGICPDCERVVFTPIEELTAVETKRLEREMNVHRTKDCEVLVNFIEQYGDYVRECTSRTILHCRRLRSANNKRSLESSAEPETPFENTNAVPDSQPRTTELPAENTSMTLELASNGGPQTPSSHIKGVTEIPQQRSSTDPKLLLKKKPSKCMEKTTLTELSPITASQPLELELETPTSAIGPHEDISPKELAIATEPEVHWQHMTVFSEPEHKAR
ncbi:hypothetical protein L211DRAFT_888300 [Terfezia boudieri ATCC MYA-4762]|uniref:Uncharacterized protein n=1 Tax=Terfezia boudieri ATCC MYA-4762 TaxID=1051890 RepID=A0A3N4LK43_9PEZI|nr:hypothetical protein L211DRAFT_888300 [Terfezia boudieri ATCC MYA-4762]